MDERKAKEIQENDLQKKTHEELTEIASGGWEPAVEAARKELLKRDKGLVEKASPEEIDAAMNEQKQDNKRVIVWTWVVIAFIVIVAILLCSPFLDYWAWASCEQSNGQSFWCGW